ncbi:MAG: hypothetical protein WCA59_20365 [Candidatus Binataceae bacterium]
MKKIIEWLEFAICCFVGFEAMFAFYGWLDLHGWSGDGISAALALDPVVLLGSAVWAMIFATIKVGLE